MDEVKPLYTEIKNGWRKDFRHVSGGDLFTQNGKDAWRVKALYMKPTLVVESLRNPGSIIELFENCVMCGEFSRLISENSTTKPWQETLADFMHEFNQLDPDDAEDVLRRMNEKFYGGDHVSNNS